MANVVKMNVILILVFATNVLRVIMGLFALTYAQLIVIILDATVLQVNVSSARMGGLGRNANAQVNVTVLGVIMTGDVTNVRLACTMKSAIKSAQKIAQMFLVADKLDFVQNVSRVGLDRRVTALDTVIMTLATRKKYV